MLPIPTRSTVALFVGLVGMLFFAIVGRSAAGTILAGSGFIGLAAALVVTMPLGRRVRRQRLEFAWWLSHGPEAALGAVVPGAPFEVRCYVRHRGSSQLSIARLSPVVPAGAEVLDEGEALTVAPRARTEFTFRLRAPAAGRVVLHGLAVNLRGPLGLFEVPLYFPNPLGIKVLPRSGAVVRGRARMLSGMSTARPGRAMMRRRGGGTELYELRELLPGDPYKSIAWKASARVGKLMVKEVEQEVQETRWIILDVSGTMRGGALGQRKLDFGIEAAAAEARRALEEGDRFGLLTVDGRVLSVVRAGEGSPHMIRVYDALLAATEVVDADLTDVDDDDVLQIVSRYVRQQDGIDFGTRAGGGLDVAALVNHLGRALAGEKRSQVQADTAAGALGRRFCRARGIPLPYRPDPRDGTKGPGLAAALRLAGGRSRDPSSIVVITDFDGVHSEEELTAMARLVRAHGHALAFVLPDGPAFAPPPVNSLERDLHAIYARGEARRAREARRILGRLGVPVVMAHPKDPPGLVLARAHRRRVA